METGDSVFHWNQTYSVHIAVLDRQHQELFATVEQLRSALAAGEGKTVIDSTLTTLVAYAQNHFAAEEFLMAKHNFPALSTHRAQHEMFRNQIAAFLKDYESGKSGVPVSLLQFMQSWLKQHVMRTDKQYSDFLNARGVH